MNRWVRNLRMTFSSTFAISSSFSSAFIRASRRSLKLSISSPSSLIRSRIFSSSRSSSSESEHKPHLQVGVVRSRCQMPIGHKLYQSLLVYVRVQFQRFETFFQAKIHLNLPNNHSVISAQKKNTKTCSGNIYPPGSSLSSHA